MTLQSPNCLSVLPSSSSVPAEHAQIQTSALARFLQRLSSSLRKKKTNFILNETFPSSSLCMYVHISATCGSLGTYVAFRNNYRVFSCSWSPLHASLCLLTCLIVLSPASCPSPTCFRPSLGSVSLCSGSVWSSAL